MPGAISLSPVIKLDGQSLGADWEAAITEVKVEAEFQVPARATLRFLERDGIGGQTPLIDDRRLALGTSIEIGAGNPHEGAASETQLFLGEITSVGFSVGVDSAPELLVTAHDRSHRMSRTTNVKTYSQVMLSDVVSELAQTAGLVAVVEAVPEVHTWVLQPDSDLGMLTEIARRTGCDWWVADNKLHFAKPSAGTTVDASLTENLMAFSIRASGHHPDEVKVRGWDRTQKTAILGSSTEASTAVVPTSPLASDARKTAAAFGGKAQMLNSSLSPTTQTEAQTVSQAVLDRAMSAAVAVRGTCVDTPTIALGTSVDIKNVSARVAGTYPVTRVEHVFRSGIPLTTRFSAGDRMSHSLVETLGAGASPRSGAFRHDGLVVGIVTNNKDPEDLNRVKIKIPGLTDDYESAWARVVTAGGGSARGNAFHPEVNDEVLVGFEGGDPRQAVVIGGLFNNTDKPPALKFDSGSRLTERTMTSRKGHIFSIVEGDEDAEKSAFLLQLAGSAAKLNLAGEGATLEMPSGKPITLKAGQSSIVIAASGAITVTSSGDLTLKAEQGAVNIQGLSVKIAAQTELKMEGQATAGLKGAIVKVEADGIAQVKGSMVQIN